MWGRENEGTSAWSSNDLLRSFSAAGGDRPGIYAGFVERFEYLGGAGVRGIAADPRTAENDGDIDEPGINAGPMTAEGT